MSISVADSTRINNKDKPLLKRLEKLIGKFIRPTHKVKPTSSYSEYNSILPQTTNDVNIIKELDKELDDITVSIQKPIENTFDYNVYMKCFIHELRTPISTISTGLHILKQNVTDADDIQTINDIKTSVIFIDNILTKFARVQDENIELNAFEPFSLQKVLGTVKILILYNFKESGVKLITHIDDSVVLWNYGDVHNIKHVIINLLKNAIKYRNEGRENIITVTVTATYVDINVQSVHISIRDTNDHLLPHIKENLFQTFNSTSGSGMGLYICKIISELHEGGVTHNFIEPVGNEFVVTLKLTMCHDESQHVHTPCSSSMKKNIPTDASRYDVLLVDDSLLNRKMMYRKLITMPIFGRIFSADDGTTALDEIQNHMDKIHLVLLDKNMPLMDGWKTAHAMRLLGYNKLIIGLTGEDSPEEIQGFIDSGVDYVITKPLDSKKIDQMNSLITKYGTDRPPNKTVQMVNDQLE